MIKDIYIQNYISMATWGIDIFEKDLNIVSNKDKDIIERRNIIKAKLRGSGKLTLKKIKITCNTFGLEIDAIFNGRLLIKFTNIIGIPKNYKDVVSAIEDIKPAHIAIEYYFRYRTHKELNLYTHKYLKNYTHKELNDKNDL